MANSALKDFELQLQGIGNRKYDAATDTYRNDRSKKIFPVSGAAVRKAAELADRDPDNWATYFAAAMKS